MKYLRLLLIVLLESSLFSQSSMCEDYFSLLEKKDPSQYFFKIPYNDIESTKRASNSLLNVPVVVHVVWKDSSDYVDLATVNDQIFVLNRDFKRQNPDTSYLRPIFQNSVKNPNIQFNLVHVEYVNTSTDFTPNWNPFNGIPLYFDAVKYTAHGGSDAWPTDQYLNIWIANLQTGSPTIVAGYATPPPQSPSTSDGVVLFWGTMPYGTALATGRTATHEVGHYLGLPHIWGDSASCSRDDGFMDTPTQKEETQNNCNYINSCNDGVGDKPDMIENYMDYSSVVCQNSFSIEQVDRMRSVLNNERVGLLNNQASISESDLNSVEVYPNPFTNNFTLKADKKIEAYQIYDQSGKLMTSANVNELLITFDGSTLNKGVYFVSIKKAGSIITKRMIKL